MCKKSVLNRREHRVHREKHILLGSYLCDLCALSGDFLLFASMSLFDMPSSIFYSEMQFGRKKMRLAAIIFFIVLLIATGLHCEPVISPESSRFPALVSSIRIREPLHFCSEPVPLKNPEVRERLEKELLLSLWDRAQVILWIKRANRYLPHIEDVLKQNSMPQDLKFVSVAESALRPHARSRKRATGFWQFIKPTGLKYGLTINSKIDERRNIFKSTQAAAKYFKALYSDLGSWTLAAAAYNMGEAGLKAEMLTQKTEDYYHLYLPLETQRFIFRILSVKLILSNPEKYGFFLEKEDLYPPMEFARIKLKCPQETPIQLIGQAAKTSFKVIKDLNPEIRGYYVAKGIHNILIPKGAAKGFQVRFREHLKQVSLANESLIYVVRKGDNLTRIADRFNVPLPALVNWNGISLRKPIHPGDRLVIYPNTADKKKTKK